MKLLNIADATLGTVSEVARAGGVRRRAGGAVRFFARAILDLSAVSFPEAFRARVSGLRVAAEHTLFSAWRILGGVSIEPAAIYTCTGAGALPAAIAQTGVALEFWRDCGRVHARA